MEAREELEISITVNGETHEREVEPRLLLSDFIRDELGLTGTHVGCSHGVCGMCTVTMDGETIRSCLTFAAQADGAEILTVEGMEELPASDDLHPLQEGFREEHGLQCGYCTPGMLMAGKALLDENPDPEEAEIREAISGNLCRCTGYQNIVKSIEYAADELESRAATDGGAVAEGDDTADADTFCGVEDCCGGPSADTAGASDQFEREYLESEGDSE